MVMPHSVMLHLLPSRLVTIYPGAQHSEPQLAGAWITYPGSENLHSLLTLAPGPKTPARGGPGYRVGLRVPAPDGGPAACNGPRYESGCAQRPRKSCAIARFGPECGQLAGHLRVVAPDMSRTILTDAIPPRGEQESGLSGGSCSENSGSFRKREEWVA